MPSKCKHCEKCILHVRHMREHLAHEHSSNSPNNYKEMNDLDLTCFDLIDENKINDEEETSKSVEEVKNATISRKRRRTSQVIQSQDESNSNNSNDQDFTYNLSKKVKQELNVNVNESADQKDSLFNVLNELSESESCSTKSSNRTSSKRGKAFFFNLCVTLILAWIKNIF
jgi:hypothetical protein